MNCGDSLEIQAFSQRLLKIGYNRVTTVREHGEFSVKGSLIDLFPMGVNSPYRIGLLNSIGHNLCDNDSNVVITMPCLRLDSLDSVLSRLEVISGWGEKWQKFYWGSLYGSAQALALSEFAQTQDQVVLVVANDITHFEQLFKSLNFYGNSLDILRFDNWEVLPFDHFSPHPDITSSRLNTLSRLSSLKHGIVITTLESLSQRLCPIEFSRQYSFSLKNGDSLEIQAFSQRLLKIGYNRVTTVREHGEFSVKGSLIDLFPMGVNSPYRIDLFDQEIESMRIFDASTQRSIEEVDRIFLLPAREFATDQDSEARQPR
jgi:transcription-repair coupling factor (superfamily II helicase)